MIAILIVLLVYGVQNGWESIDPVFWWLFCGGLVVQALERAKHTLLEDRILMLEKQIGYLKSKRM